MDTEHTPLPWKTTDGVTVEGADGTPVFWSAYALSAERAGADVSLLVHSVNLLPEALAALSDLHAFVAVIFGRGEDASIPETITTPLGVPVKIGAIMRDAEAAIRALRAKEGT